MLSHLFQPHGPQGMMVGQERFECLVGDVLNCREIEVIPQWLALYLAYLFLSLLPLFDAQQHLLCSLELLWGDQRP